MCVKVSSTFERMKRKQNKEWKEKSTVKHEEMGNIKEKIFVILEIYLKQSKKRKKTYGY